MFVLDFVTVFLAFLRFTLVAVRFCLVFTQVMAEEIISEMINNVSNWTLSHAVNAQLVAYELKH